MYAPKVNDICIYSTYKQVPAGGVEVIVTAFTLLNPADRNMPFMPFDTQNLVRELSRDFPSNPVDFQLISSPRRTRT